MKHLLLISILSLTFTQELKVEGNLNVTGAVINDSLVQVIDSLKATNVAQQQQINAQQSLIEQLQAQILLLGQQLGLVDCSGEIGGDAVLDNCGVCDNDPANDCLQDCAGNWGGDTTEDACGICGGDAVSEDECFEIYDIDGNGYDSVVIGTQEWMTESLKVTHYRNGDEIPNITNNSDWGNLTTGAYVDYDDNPSNSEIYGRIYNWYTVDDARGLCPAGWHVPTDNEFTVLINYLGGESVAGGKMKDIGLEHWNSPNTGATNESGFTALPAGYRYIDGNYYEMGDVVYYWSSTDNGGIQALRRRLYYDSSEIGRGDNVSHWGYSVRCLKD